jgi:Skp family chaperone for outer membrane proteins
MLQGQALLDAMDKEARTIEQKLNDDSTFNQREIKFALAEAYLRGANAALSAEVARHQAAIAERTTQARKKP